MATLLGLFRLGRDAEVRYLPTGEPVCNLSLAYGYGKRSGGEQPTQWIDAALWGPRTEKLAPHLMKGKLIFASIDDVHIETFIKQDGSPGHKLSGRLGNLEFAGGRDDAQGAQGTQQAAPKHSPAAKPQAPAGGFDDMDDDIPF